MPNDQAHDTRVTNPVNRLAQAVGLSVAGVASGGASGGTAAFAYSAPNGLVDGETITVTTDGSGGLDFGTNALNYAALGFGDGFIETNPEGTPLEDTVDPITGKALLYENAASNGRTPNRLVVTKDGVRALRHSASGPDVSIAGGFINFDFGRNINADEYVFVTSWIKATAITLGVGTALGSQIKTYRFRHTMNLDGDSFNTSYAKIFTRPEDFDDPQDGEYTRYAYDGTASTYYDLTHPAADNKWTRQDIEIKFGDFGASDGEVITRTLKPVDSNGFIGRSRLSADLMWPDSSPRPRYAMLQDYINHCEDPEIFRTDLLFQFGTRSRFELANGATPATTTDAKVLLPVTWSTTSVNLKLYKQMLADYAGKYLHFYDHDGVFRGAVAL